MLAHAVCQNSKYHLHVGAGEAIVGIEAEGNIFSEHWGVALCCCQLDLVLGDLLWGALDLLKVETHVGDVVRTGQVVSHDLKELLKFLRVARDERNGHLPGCGLHSFELLLLIIISLLLVLLVRQLSV